MSPPPRHQPPAASRRGVPPTSTRPRGWRRFLPGWKLIGLVAAVLVVGFAGLLAAVWFSTGLPDPNAFATYQASDVYYADGSHEIGHLGSTNRDAVPLTRVPKPVQEAVLAAEDRHFYNEPAVSPTGMVRALWTDLRGGEIAQGGSTITQQYVKNYYLTQQRTVTRKLREIVISLKVGQEKSKQQILTDYLNTIYFGRGAYGIAAASTAYFGVPVNRLNVAQGAVLAAQIQSPSHDPADPAFRQATRARWHYVLDGLVKMGDLSQATADAQRYPRLTKPVTRQGGGPNGFILRAVQDDLARHGFSEDQINRGGLRIVTTIDRKAQNAAVKAETDLFANVVHTGGANPPASALVAVKPGDGAVVAMYGGRDYGKNGCAQGSFDCFNFATQAEAQPGSSFKPYVLAAALEQGISIHTRLNGPPTWTDPNGGVVHNDSGESCDNCNLVTALARSINTIYVPLAAQVGPKSVAEAAHAAGIPASVPLQDKGGFVSDRIALGVYPVHPIDQAVGYATFAARGRQADPYLVTKVLDHGGHTLYTVHRNTNQAFRRGVSDDVTYAMEHVVTEGTATAAQLAGGRPAAGKTGTTEQNSNAWFIGFTAPGKGQLAAAVWIGHAAKVAPLTDIPGYESGVFGGTLPAKIWKTFMDAAMRGAPVTQFPPPANVGTVARESLSPSATPSSPSPSVSSSVSPSPSTSSPTPPATPSSPPSPTPPSPTPPSPTPPPTSTPSPPRTTPPPKPGGSPNPTGQAPGAPGSTPTGG